MIIAAFLLVAIGAADLLRQFVSPARRWAGYLVGALLLFALGGLCAAPIQAIGGMVAAAAWVWTMPDAPDRRRAFWPAVVLAVLCVAAVMFVGERADAGVLGAAWHVPSPFGLVPFDLAMLVAGVLVFLLESGNVVVRAALAGEHAWQPSESHAAREADDDAEPDAAPPAPVRTVFAGGRLIGPLERVLVLALTLVGGYALLAAMLAAKGIVRFPEISKDGETGARAEYFLVGSLVSWVTALGGALLVWWAAAS